MELLSKLLKTMVAKDASDLFLCTGSSPAFRIDGALQTHPKWPNW
jgi:Tfp pilus assembly pilus retraction ATPase PilT